jgi:hypothetical protein
MEVDDVWLTVGVQPVKLSLVERQFASENGTDGQ